MTRRPQSRFFTVALLVAAVALSVGLAALRAGWLQEHWDLDVARAMDAIGLAPGMVVGEAGAGDGYFTLPMARRVGPAGAVVANDISARALRSLEERSRREGLKNVTTVLGAVDDPKFPRDDLQMVVIVHAFHDFSRPVEWLTNLKKYLREDATVAIIDRDPEQGAPSHFWPRERVIRQAREAGYELVKGVFDVSDHLILVFRAKPHADDPAGREAVERKMKAPMRESHEKEGVVKYTVRHETARITFPPEMPDLFSWRRRLRALDLIGADAEGLGYGNVSIRLYGSPSFLITGSQSSGLEEVDQQHFARVTVVDLDKNFLRSVGERPPSSEALTHAALYQVNGAIRAVVHVHSRPIWESWRNQLPTSREEVLYGTPEMAYEMIRLHKRAAMGRQGVIVMGGHQDGVVAFAPSVAEAAGEILKLLPGLG